MIDPDHDIFTERAVSDDVRDERGYRRYDAGSAAHDVLRELDPRHDLAVCPWRRVGGHVYASAPLTAGPTRYRVLERTERRHRWHEPETRHYEVVGTEYDLKGRPHSIVMWRPAAGVDALDGLSEPRLYEHELTTKARDDTAPRDLTTRDRWGRPTAFYAPRLDDPEPEPDVIPWDALTPEERELSRLSEYEPPWAAYPVTVPKGLGLELTPDEERTATLMAEPRGDGGQAMAELEWLAAGGWTEEIPPPTGEPAGRPRSWPEGVPVSAQEELVDDVGVDRETVAMLYVRGKLGDIDRQGRDWVDQRIAAVVAERRGTGVVEALAAAYGVSPSTIKRAARRGRK